MLGQAVEVVADGRYAKMTEQILIDPRQEQAIKREIKKIEADKESEIQCSECKNNCICKNIRGLCKLPNYKKEGDLK